MSYKLCAFKRLAVPFDLIPCSNGGGGWPCRDTALFYPYLSASFTWQPVCMCKPAENELENGARGLSCLAFQKAFRAFAKHLLCNLQSALVHPGAGEAKLLACSIIQS